LGSTSVNTAMVARVASDALTPYCAKLCSPKREPPTKRHRPTMPFKINMMVANTVSRASPVAAGPPESISETIKASSITVIAIASTRVP